MRHVTIVGGGITGMAAAFYLQRKARAQGRTIAYTLVDDGTQLGGKIRTDHVEQFTIEGGPDSFVVDKPWCLQLCHDAGLGDQLIPSNEIQRKIYVLRNGKLVALPSGFRLAVPMKLKPFLLTPLLSPLGKLRMAMDYFLPPRRESGDESLASFIRRRFGQEALERIAGPLMAGIFVSDPERMSMMGTFPSFLEMEREYGSLIRATRARRIQAAAAPPPSSAGGAMFNTLKKGMGALAEAVRQRLDGEIRLRSRVAGLERKHGRWAVSLDHQAAFETDAVVLAIPAFHAAALLEPHHARLASMLRAIRYVDSTTVSLAYLRDDVPPACTLDGFGVLIPPREKRGLMACTWASTKFKHRAPPGCVLLRAFVGGHANESLAALPDDELLNLVTNEFASLFSIVAKPMLHRIYRWPRGNPQYDVGHLERVDEMERLASELPGLYLAGSAYRGIGMPDCIKNALAAVDKLLAL